MRSVFKNLKNIPFFLHLAGIALLVLVANFFSKQDEQGVLDDDRSDIFAIRTASADLRAGEGCSDSCTGGGCGAGDGEGG